MAVFNAAKREIDIKIVYYGPALCGKTTNVQCVHKMLAPTQRGDIMSLATKDDRTLFFDFLPIELGDVKGFKTRFHVYTVPGQVYYALTRRAVLTGVDGVVFVADSQASKLDENIESLQDLNENLNYYKKDLSTIPFVMQYNKRDMDNILPVAELEQKINTMNVPNFAASAVDGTGVIETLTACCKLVFKQMDSSGGAKKRRRQRQDVAEAPAPLPTSTPPKATADAGTASGPSSPALSFEDDEGPVIKIIADDEPRPQDSPQPATPEPTLSSFDIAAVQEDQTPSVPDSAAPENLFSDEGVPDAPVDAEPAAEPATVFPDISAPPSDADIEAPSPQEPEKNIASTLPLSGASVTTPQAQQSGLDLPFESAGAEESTAPETSAPVFELAECGTPEKITNKAVNIPLMFKDTQTGRKHTVTVTVSFDEFSIT